MHQNQNSTLAAQDNKALAAKAAEGCNNEIKSFKDRLIKNIAEENNHPDTALMIVEAILNQSKVAIKEYDTTVQAEYPKILESCNNIKKILQPSKDLENDDEIRNINQLIDTITATTRYNAADIEMLMKNLDNLKAKTNLSSLNVPMQIIKDVIKEISDEVLIKDVKIKDVKANTTLLASCMNFYHIKAQALPYWKQKQQEQKNAIKQIDEVLNNADLIVQRLYNDSFSAGDHKEMFATQLKNIFKLQDKKTGEHLFDAIVQKCGQNQKLDGENFTALKYDYKWQEWIFKVICDFFSSILTNDKTWETSKVYKDIVTNGIKHLHKLSMNDGDDVKTYDKYTEFIKREGERIKASETQQLPNYL